MPPDEMSLAGNRMGNDADGTDRNLLYAWLLRFLAGDGHCILPSDRNRRILLVHNLRSKNQGKNLLHLSGNEPSGRSDCDSLWFFDIILLLIAGEH